MKKNAWIILIGTFILMIVGFYNGYPLVYSDTGTYIYSGFDKFVPPDRPITYGLFLWIFSFKFSLWPVIVVQNLITAFVLFEVIALFCDLKEKKFTFIYLSILLFLTFFTGLGWYSNQIMPDFFTPVMILTFALLIFNKNIPLPKKILLYLILVISIVVHLSHLMISLLLVITYFLAERILYKKRMIPQISLSPKITMSLLAAVLFSWLALSSIHYSFGGGFKPSKASYMFFAAHLTDAGLMKKYLDANCEKTEFKSTRLCACKDSLPTDIANFLWGPYAPFENHGGWEKGEQECREIVLKMFKSPRFILLNIYKSLTYGTVQLFKNEIGQGLSAYNPGSPPYGQIEWRFREELNNYMNSRQNRWNGAELNLKTLNTFHLIILLFSLAAIFYIYFLPSVQSLIKPKLLLFLMFCLLAIIVNSFVTAGLNAPCERFQARVVWLLPFALILILINHWKQSKINK
jgi:hypothetical protein